MLQCQRQGGKPHPGACSGAQPAHFASVDVTGAFSISKNPTLGDSGGAAAPLRPFTSL